MADLWVENRHPDWEIEVLRRQYTRDQYTGRALEVAKSEANAMDDNPDTNTTPKEVSNFMSEDNLPQYRYRVGYVGGGASFVPNSNGGFGTYLVRRSQGEASGAFNERARITRFPSHMAALVDAYSGGISAVEGEGKWIMAEGEPLGSKDDPSSPMHRMWHDIDGTGRNWYGQLNSAKTKLITDDRVCSFTYLPEGGTNPLTELIDPDRIVDWHEEGGRAVWILVAEDKIERPDVHEPAEFVRYYTEYSLEGWVRYRVSKDEKGEEYLEVVDAEDWKHKFYTDSTRTTERLPFTWMKFSDLLGREVGYQMAQDHNALYNLLSDARWNFRVINHPRLVGDVEDNVFTKGVEGINAGANGLQGKWGYITPDSSNAADAYETYEREVKQFYVTNHQRMNAPSIEKSATEVLYNQAEGRTAFLSLMVSAVDELDNDWRFLSSQIMAPSSPDLWHSSHVVRSRDFKPVDIENLIQKHVINFVSASGTGIPVELAARIATEGFTKEVQAELAKIIKQEPPEPIEPEEEPEEQEEGLVSGDD